MRIFAAASLILILGAVNIDGQSPAEKPADQSAAKAFKQDVQPVLQQFCVRCHGPEKQKAKLRLDQLNADLVAGSDAETWHDVLNKLNLGEMPPDKEPQPSKEDRQKTINWLTAQLKRAADQRRSTGGRVVLRRLTRYEYNNTMRDLLGLELDYAENLPPEPKSKDGFKNNGQSLGISPIQMEYYLKAARSALSKAIVSGPKPQIFTHQVTKSDKGKSRKGSAVSPDGRVLPGEIFLARCLEFPREGLIRVRVTAEAEVPQGQGYPRMKVSIGHRADVHSPDLALGVIDLMPTKGPQTYTFTGRIERFPLPGHNPKFPGMLVSVTNDCQIDVDLKKLRQKIAKLRKTAKSKKKDAAEKAKQELAKIVIPKLPTIVIKSVDFEGPVFDSWPPRSHRNILFDKPTSTTESSYARKVIEQFAGRAYRRPITADDIDPIFDFYQSVRPKMPNFEGAIREALAMVLISPDFLYLVEPAGSRKGLAPLTNHELASRLSYFLWSTMPDQALRRSADSGKLSQPVELEKQVRRMIADERSQSFIEHFTGQWLDLSGLERVAINPEYYPKFNDDLKRHMKYETLHFFAEVLRKDLSAMTLIDSDFVMINEPLAKHYDISGPKGMAFARVAVKESDRRGGLLTQASILMINSTGEDSHPIRRAVWLRDRLLDDPPAAPPPDVPELKSEDANFASLPLKQQLELHRKKASCNDCHAQIDPWGIPFENYDAIGKWREQVNRVVKRKKNFVKSPVVAESTLPSGHKVSGINDLKQYLKTHQRRQFARALVRKLLAYSLGRSLEFTDGPQVDALVRDFTDNDYRLDELIVSIVKSKAFSSK